MMTWCNAKIKEQAQMKHTVITTKLWKSFEASVSGRYNTPLLQEDLVPRSRMPPERKAEEEEVKQSCFLTNEWNQRTLEVEKLERNDTTEISELRALRSKRKTRNAMWTLEFAKLWMTRTMDEKYMQALRLKRDVQGTIMIKYDNAPVGKWKGGTIWTWQNESTWMRLRLEEEWQTPTLRLKQHKEGMRMI